MSFPLQTFKTFLSQAAQLKPYPDGDLFAAIFQKHNHIVQQLIAGGSKQHYLDSRIALGKAFDEYVVTFQVQAAHQLEALSLLATKDAQYAAKQKLHESKHARDILSFVPTKPQETKPVPFFCISMISGGGILPTCSWTTPAEYTKIEDRSRTTTTNSLLLEKSWCVETIRAFWRHMQQATAERSTYDDILLTF